MTEAAGRPRWLRIARGLGVVLLALLLLTSPWWGRALLARSAFFRLRHVEFYGARFVPPAELLDLLAVDTTASVWDDLDPLRERLRTHVQVSDVTLSRDLPGTLVVHVVENLPVAMVPERAGFAVLDARGRPLPIDPSRTPIDLPVIGVRDTGIVRLLAELRAENPGLYGRVSEVRRLGRGELLLQLREVPVRVMADVTPARLGELLLVEEDLARRQARVAEIDLRFRDQVIARVQ